MNRNVINTNEITKYKEEFSSLDNWDVTTGTNDSVTIRGNVGGSRYACISKSSTTSESLTTLISKFKFRLDVKAKIGISLSQRINSQRCSFDLVECDANGILINNVSVSQDVNISTLSQNLSTLTIVTQTPRGLVALDRFIIKNVADTRANYPECIVHSVNSPTSITVYSTPYGSLPYINIPTQTTGQIKKIDVLHENSNSLSIIWEGNNPNVAKVASRNNNSNVSITNDTFFGSSNTIATTLTSSAFSDSFMSVYDYNIITKPDNIIIRSTPTDQNGAQGGSIKRTKCIPDTNKYYKVRVSALNPYSFSRPIAKIVSISKAGSTTATVTTSTNHNLTTGSYVQIYGVRDQINFPNGSPVVVSSVISPTQFTVIIGTSSTSSSRGGAVILINGGVTTSALPVAVSSISRTNNLMYINTNVNPSGILVSEDIDLYGLYDIYGNYLNYEGSYKIAQINSNQIVVYSTGINFSAINCGGCILKRTIFRLQDLNILEYTYSSTDIDQCIGNSSDPSTSLPVTLTQLPTLSMVGNVQGTTPHDGEGSNTNPVKVGGTAITRNPTPVSSSGDVVDLICTMIGSQVITPYSIPQHNIFYASDQLLEGGEPLLIFDRNEFGFLNYITGIQYINTSETDTDIQILEEIDGTFTVMWNGFAPSRGRATTVINFITPLSTKKESRVFVLCPSHGVSVYFNAQGYVAPG